MVLREIEFKLDGCRSDLNGIIARAIKYTVLPIETRGSGLVAKVC